MNDTGGSALPSLGRRSALFLGMVGFATAVLLSPGSPPVDTLRRLQVTHSLWTDSPPVTAKDRADNYGVIGLGGKVHAIYGIGHSLIMLPADVLATRATARVPAAVRDRLRVALVLLATFPLVSALILVAAAWFLVVLGFSEREAVLAAIGLQFATTLLNYTQVNQENSFLLLTALVGLGGQLRWALTGRLSAAVAGILALGFALLVRITAAMDIAAVTGCTLFVAASVGIGRTSRGPAWRRALFAYLAACGAIYAAFLAMDRMYHFHRFGRWLGTYQHIMGEQLRAIHPELPPSFPFSTPLLVGVRGALFSPERSIFLFEPLLILALGLAVALWPRLSLLVRAVLATATGLLAVYVFFYARYWAWHGASAWGDRYLTVPTQLVALLALAVLARHARDLGRPLRAAAAGLVALAVVIQLGSVVFWYLLEESQHAHGLGTRFTVAQRAVNIAAGILGRFRTWQLVPEGSTPQLLEPHFLVFRWRAYFPASVRPFATAAWACAAIALACVVVAKVRALCPRSSRSTSAGPLAG